MLFIHVMSLVIEPEKEIEKRIKNSTSSPEDQLIREIICVAANCYWDFKNNIQSTKGWSWATWIMESGITNPIDIYCEAAFLVAQNHDCLNNRDKINVKSEVKNKINEV